MAYGLAQWQLGQPCTPENYLLEKGPGQWTLAQQHCRLDGPLYRHFPRDRRLAQHCQASYQGWLLRDEQQTPIGILCLLHSAPLPPAGLLDGWLAPYLPRLSAELQRQRQHQARAAQGRRQQLLLEHSLTLLALLDGEGHLLSMSPALCQALGSPASALLGRPPVEPAAAGAGPSAGRRDQAQRQAGATARPALAAAADPAQSGCVAAPAGSAYPSPAGYP
ncbi:MAG: hypothetical protein LRY38_02910 [Aeromonadaceae bacterium]|nr:hypothetical protein [Aeromonadaceae bacterium]